MAGGHVGLEQQRRCRPSSARAACATYLAGSQYITWLSLSDVCTSMRRVGRGREVRVGAVASSCSRSARGSCGLPHSSNSPTVSGSDSSSMVLITSTNGTCEQRAVDEVGPQVEHRAHQQAARAAALDHQPVAARCTSGRPGARRTAMKSVNVFLFFSIRPSSCQRLPSSPPPRMWAMRDRHAAVEQAQPARREGRPGTGCRRSRSRSGSSGLVPSRGVALPVDERDRAPGCRPAAVAWRRSER